MEYGFSRLSYDRMDCVYKLGDLHPFIMRLTLHLVIFLSVFKGSLNQKFNT